MRDGESAHREKGLIRVLSKSWAYNLFQRVVWRKQARIGLMRELVDPFPGCRILDIGCGTGEILSYMPGSIGEYHGFDMNLTYIEFAKKRWKDKADFKFFCENVKDATVSKSAYYDVVLALGILHHLTDREAGDLFKVAHQALKTNGALITYDNVYVENQNWFAKWLISHDRGKAVRTVDGYRRLATRCFTDVEGDIRHDLLKVPYTMFIMRCVK